MAIINHEDGAELNIPSTGKFAIMFHLPGHCAGCKMAHKILEAKNLDNITVELIDAGNESNRFLIDKYEAKMAPTVVVFENGEQIAKTAGLKDFKARHVELFGE